MLQTGKESLPDSQSYDMILGMLFETGRIDAALKYVDLALKSGSTLSMKVFSGCLRGCINKGRLDTLVSIIDRCKVHNSCLIQFILEVQILSTLYLCGWFLLVLPVYGTEQSTLSTLEYVQPYSGNCHTRG